MIHKIVGIRMIIYDFKVGYSCNNDCLHCVNGDMLPRMSLLSKPLDLTTFECLETISQIKRLGADKIVITGGEPTIRPDFVRILESCSDMGLRIELQTNGRAFADFRLCEEIERMRNITWINVAVHGDQEIHDTITRRQGSFSETFEGIRNLVRIDKRVSGKIVMSQLNVHNLVTILEILHSLGVKRAGFAFPHALGNAREHFATIMPRYSALRPVLLKLVSLAAQLNLSIKFEAVPFCVISEHPECVGEIRTINGPKELFKPVHETIRDWSAIRPAIKGKGSRCRQCCYDRVCEGPWKEYLDHFGDDELNPVSLGDAPVDKFLTELLRLRGH